MNEVSKLLEYGGENILTKEEESGLVTIQEVINQFQYGCVVNHLLRSYTTALGIFLMYVFKFDRYTMHKNWIKRINTFYIC